MSKIKSMIPMLSLDNQTLVFMLGINDFKTLSKVFQSGCYLNTQKPLNKQDLTAITEAYKYSTL